MNNELREKILEALVEGIRIAETRLPIWVYKRLWEAYEKSEGIARAQLSAILKNVEIAASELKPMCQDTGLLIFEVELGREFPVDEEELRKLVEEAARRATREVPIRPNTMDPITGKNPGDNTGRGIPIIHITGQQFPRIGD